ncbi:MAG TPA: MCE family protein [Desulfonatronum sp.]|nr:MCE family protein [Desulfonatronum sp.]
MSAQVNSVKLGLFVLITLGLLMTGLLILGGGSLWRERVLVETYLNESAQGLEVGSMVKMRGVQVGHIETISFVYAKYPEAYQGGFRYVLVEIGLIPVNFGDFPQEQFAELLHREIESGLRIRIAPQGLTGAAYLDLDYIDPKRGSVLPFNWEPSLPYIPSAPGAIARFEETFESVSKTLANIEAINLGQPVERLEALLNSLLEKVEAVRTDLISEEATALLSELRETNQRVIRLLGEKGGDLEHEGDIYGILADISKTMHQVRMLAEQVSAWTGSEEGGLEDLRISVSFLRQSLDMAPEVLRDFSDTARSGQASFEQISELTRQLRVRLAVQQEQLEALLRNLERTAENLREITEDAKEYPSRLFFGEPPQHSE